MAPNIDAFTDYDGLLAARTLSDPWVHSAGQKPVYGPDYELLADLLSIPVAAVSQSQSGRFAKGIDAWLAQELRRAGFSADEVWPRATRPRVLPRDVAVLLDKLPGNLAQELRGRLPQLSAVGPSDARVLGRAYEKQVDVCIARWDRGPELLLSTKAQVSSFAKNLPNRFEEAYGDAGNLRGRYPLAAVGFFFVQRSTVLDNEPDAFERAVDMIRKLRDTGDGNGYTATGLALVGWDDPASTGTRVHVELDPVPADIAPAQFLTAMIGRVLAVSPIAHHVEVRSKYERRDIPVPEADQQTEASRDEDSG